MIGYPITYGDILEKGNGLTSKTVPTTISKYCSNKENLANFSGGYKFGLLVFGITGILLSSKAAFVSDSGMLPAKNGANSVGSCLETGSPPSGTPGSLANVTTTDRGVYGTSVLGICSIAMENNAY